MTQPLCKLPSDLGNDIAQFEDDVSRFLAGELSPAIFKARRVPRGIYEQRQDGTYMLRVRVPGGLLSAQQMKTLARLARSHGDGQLHVTTRQDVQFHGLDIADTPAMMRQLMTVGLSSKGGGGNTVRNITACPFAGVCPLEVFDVTPFAFAATEFFLPLTGSYNLPRKFKVAFSGCSVDCALARVNDVGLIAGAREGEAGFTLYAGGGMGAQSRVADLLVEWLPALSVVGAIEAIRRLFDKMGDRHNRHRARLRFVLERIGVAAFREALREEMNGQDGAPSAGRNIPAAIIDPQSQSAPPSGPPIETRAGLSVLPQRQAGFSTVNVHLPLGFISADTFDGLAGVAERFSRERACRTTRQQNLLLRFVANGNLPSLSDALQALFKDSTGPSSLEHFVACAGASTCRLGLCLSRNAARACAEAIDTAGLSQDTLRLLDINISGCPNSCGQHPISSIGLSGSAQRSDGRLVPSYGVFLGERHDRRGGRFGRSIGVVPAQTLPTFLVDLLRDYQSNRLGGETFVDYVERKGLPHFRGQVESFAGIPPYSQDPSFYRDLGQNEDFSLAGRGAGECGAGVFDVVRDDIATARKALEAARTSGSGESYYQALLPTVRALLITRGVDTQDPDLVFRAFELHFVDTELVSADYRGLVARGRGYVAGWSAALDGKGEEIQALLERVELLYSTLDSNLVFHPPETAATLDSIPMAPAADTADRAGAAGATVSTDDNSRGSSPDGPVPIGALDDGQLQGLRANAERAESSSLQGSQAGTVSSTATAVMDLHGVACPMNFVKAKLRLETLEVGDTLSLQLDDGEPIENVPGSFRSEGHEVVQTRRLENGHWEVVIKKRQ